LVLPFTCSTNTGRPLVTGYDFGGLGGSISLLTPGGDRHAILEPDISGSGGFFQILGGTPTSYFYVDGLGGGSNTPLVYLNGAASSVILDSNASGNAAAQLPASSISAPEILDEPGISQGKVNEFATVTSTMAMADVVTTTITIPATGYIHLTAHAQAGLGGTTGSNYVIAQIDETAGGTEDMNHSEFVGAFAFAGTLNNYMPYSNTRTYLKAAGTYTFRLEAQKQGGGGSAYFYNPTLTAIYLPTSYGTVTTAVTAAEAADFQRIERTVSAGQSGRRGGDGALVDLRELELKAARMREAATAAERDLLHARLEAQRAGAAKSGH
jgi:hypothetical protein